MMPFWIALQFLTLFPIQLKQMPSKQQNGQSLLFYPVIGLGIGLVLYTIALGLSALPSLLSALLFAKNLPEDCFQITGINRRKK